MLKNETNLAGGDIFYLAGDYFNEKPFDGFPAECEFGSWWNTVDKVWEVKFTSNFLAGTAYFDNDMQMWRIYAEDCYELKY